MTSLKAAARRERIWARLTAWASRNLREATDARRRAQREDYLRKRVLNPPASDLTINQLEEDEDEFFG